MTHPEGGPQIKHMDAAAFDDVATALSLVGAEVIHEVAHTLNFLRFLLRERSSSDADAEVIRFASTELDRMQRMAGDLRRFKLPVPQLTDVSLSQVVGQSVECVRGTVAPCAFSVDVGIPSNAVVRTDVACLRAALRNLLLDALDRVPAGSPIGITADTAGEHPLEIEFSDAGEALPDCEATVLDWRNAGPVTPTFRRTIAHCLLRHIGWSMSYDRQGPRNVFRLTAPTPMSPWQ